jgi:hypothetical protein
VTGIDFVPRALGAAARKAAAAGVAPRLVLGDVTRLAELGLGDGYGLLLDLGCFHAVPLERRDAYAAGVTAAAAPGATFLLYSFAPGQLRPRLPGPGQLGLMLPGTRPEEVERRFAGWDVLRADRSTDPVESYWFRLRRRQRSGAPGSA